MVLRISSLVVDLDKESKNKWRIDYVELDLRCDANLYGSSEDMYYSRHSGGITSSPRFIMMAPNPQRQLTRPHVQDAITLQYNNAINSFH